MSSYTKQVALASKKKDKMKKMYRSLARLTGQKAGPGVQKPVGGRGANPIASVLGCERKLFISGSRWDTRVLSVRKRG
jgi:hypothetical protein